MMICKRHPVKNLQGFQIGMPIFFQFHAGSAAFPRDEETADSFWLSAVPVS